MKKIISSVIFLLFIFGISCTPEEPKPNNHNYSEEEQALKDSLIGYWIDFPKCTNCVDGFSYVFTEDDSIHIIDKTYDSGEPVYYKVMLSNAYKVITPDSIEITRDEDFPEEIRVNRCKVEFTTADTVLITDFLVNYYDTPFPFHDVILHKLR